MNLYNTSNDLGTIAEVNTSLSESGFAVMVRVISESSVERFVYTPGSESELEVNHTGVSEWLREFYHSKQESSVRKFGDMGRETICVVAERIRGRLRLHIFGAGHVGQAIALMGALVGYEVSVVDDRAEFASRKWVPDPRVKLVVGEFDTVIRNSSLGLQDAAVIVTRGHQFDEMCLRELLGLKLSYLGMIGSKRRVLSIFNKLKSDGFGLEDFDRVHAPIGLMIGAKSPQEIAVAVLAEIISVVNK